MVTRLVIRVTLGYLTRSLVIITNTGVSQQSTWTCSKLSTVGQFNFNFKEKERLRYSTGCPTKNYTLFWKAVAPLNFELGIKVGGVLESSGSQLFKTVPTFDF